MQAEHVGVIVADSGGTAVAAAGAGRDHDRHDDGDHVVDGLPSDLTGKVVAVLGGASGVGFTAAQRLVARGEKVAICGLEELDGCGAARRLRGGATSHPVGRRDPDPADWSLLRVVVAHGGLHVAINAGGPDLWRALDPIRHVGRQGADFDPVCAALVYVIVCEAGYMTAADRGGQDRGVIVNLLSNRHFGPMAVAAAFSLGFFGIRLVNSHPAK